MHKVWAVLIALISCPAFAWDQHRQITHLAAEKLAFLDARATVETLDHYLLATGFNGSQRDFLRQLKLNQASAFPFAQGESVGAHVSLRSVVETYSDEPDWQMDQELFDQYPELWKDEYVFMGGRQGLGSRAFRHMYWAGGFFKPPVPPSQAPVHDPTPLGVAPERAKLFFEQSREAFRRGHPYWGARFLGWSLHYLEDLSQPFHASQLPSFAYISRGPDGSIDIAQTARQVAYFHFATDGYPSHGALFGAANASRLNAALSGAQTLAFAGAQELALQTAVSAMRQAPEVGEAALAVFPPPSPADRLDPADRIATPEFWLDSYNLARAAPDKTERYVSALEARLKPAGDAVRTLITEALRPDRAKPAPAPGHVSLPAHFLEGQAAAFRSYLMGGRAR